MLPTIHPPDQQSLTEGPMVARYPSSAHASLWSLGGSHLSEDAKATIFIGSSVEGLSYANAVFNELERTTIPTVWDQDVFTPSNSTLEDLEIIVHSYDFAVYVATPDDLRISRGSAASIPRDNIIAELSMFIGAIGRERVFLLQPRDDAIVMPSDYLGIHTLEYTNRPDNIRGAVRGACTIITRRIERLGRRPPPSTPVNLHTSPSSLERADVINFFTRIVGDNIISEGIYESVVYPLRVSTVIWRNYKYDIELLGKSTIQSSQGYLDARVECGFDTELTTNEFRIGRTMDEHQHSEIIRQPNSLFYWGLYSHEIAVHIDVTRDTYVRVQNIPVNHTLATDADGSPVHVFRLSDDILRKLEGERVRIEFGVTVPLHMQGAHLANVARPTWNGTFRMRLRDSIGGIVKAFSVFPRPERQASDALMPQETEGRATSYEYPGFLPAGAGVVFAWWLDSQIG